MIFKKAKPELHSRWRLHQWGADGTIDYRRVTTHDDETNQVVRKDDINNDGLFDRAEYLTSDGLGRIILKEIDQANGAEGENIDGVIDLVETWEYLGDDPLLTMKGMTIMMVSSIGLRSSVVSSLIAPQWRPTFMW